MGFATLFSWLGSFIGGPLTAITGQVAGVFTNKQNVQQAEFTAMTAADRDQVIALLQAQQQLNSLKVTNNAHGAAYFFVWLFGLPVAIHWWAVIITATFHLGIAIDPLKGTFGDAEKQIALSFFLLAPALPVLNGLASRLRG